MNGQIGSKLHEMTGLWRVEISLGPCFLQFSFIFMLSDMFEIGCNFFYLFWVPLGRIINSLTQRKKLLIFLLVCFCGHCLNFELLLVLRDFTKKASRKIYFSLPAVCRWCVLLFSLHVFLGFLFSYCKSNWPSVTLRIFF